MTESEIDTYQVMPPLDGPTEDALTASIERYGVLVPVVVDQHGLVIDGHHRKRIADSLGIPYETEVYQVNSFRAAREMAVTLNVDRRQLEPEQRREVVAGLRTEGHAIRSIAKALGVAHMTVQRDVEALEAGGTPVTPDRIKGADGKSYPSRRGTKRCGSCQEERPMTSFGRDRTSPDGRGTECRLCARKRLLNKPDINPTKTREAVAARVTKVREMAAKGHLADQIAREVGLSLSRVREIAKQHEIDLRADRIIGRARATNWNRVMSQLAMDADTIAEGTAGLNYGALDGELIPEWISSIEQAISDLQVIRRNLREERNRRT